MVGEAERLPPLAAETPNSATPPLRGGGGPKKTKTHCTLERGFIYFLKGEL